MLSIFFSAVDTSNSSDVSYLKGQMSGLENRIAQLTDEIERLTGAVSVLQLNNSLKQENTTTNNHTVEVGSLKKRKTMVNASHEVDSEGNLGPSSPLPPSTNVIRMSSDDSSLFVEQLIHSGEELLPGPQLQFLTSSTTETDPWIDNFDLMLYDDGTMDPGSCSDKRTNELNSKPTSLVALESNCSITDTTLLHDTEMKSSSDITAILNALPEDLKKRFVDRLADNMAMQMAKKLFHQTSSHQSGLTNLAQESVSLSTEYVLPSGAPAPEIALPLAAAAMMSTMRTMLANNVLSRSQLPADEGQVF
jgi:hypothetical protein